MATQKKLSHEQLVLSLKEAGISLFTDRSGFPLSQAQRNLEGRTHYVDDKTLKAFDGKVHSTHVLDDGLVFGIVESVKPADAARSFRPVFFDLFGNVVARPELEDSSPSLAKAMTLFWSMAEDIDSPDVTIKGIKEKQKYLQDGIDKLDDLMKAIR